MSPDPSSEPTTEDAMLEAIANFLKSQGWNVAVIGGTRIQQQLGDAEFHFEFVVRFTGTKPAGNP